MLKYYTAVEISRCGKVWHRIPYVAKVCFDYKMQRIDIEGPLVSCKGLGLVTEMLKSDTDKVVDGIVVASFENALDLQFRKVVWAGDVQEIEELPKARCIRLLNYIHPIVW